MVPDFLTSKKKRENLISSPTLLCPFLKRTTLATKMKRNLFWDFPGGPVVKNLLSIAGDMGSIPGQGTKIRHSQINNFSFKVAIIKATSQEYPKDHL